MTRSGDFIDRGDMAWIQGPVHSHNHTLNPEQLPFSLRIHAAWRLFPSSPIPHLPTPPSVSSIWISGFF